MIIEGEFINMGRGIFWFRTNEPQELGFLPLERNENYGSPEATFHATFESKQIFFSKRGCQEQGNVIIK